MTSDFEKRPQGSIGAAGSPAGAAAGDRQQGYAPGGAATGGGQSGFGQNVSGGQGTAGHDRTVAGESGGVKDAVGREASSARAEIGSAAEQVKQGVSSLGETARDKAIEGVERGKSEITSSLGDFAAAVRKASHELGERDQSMAAGLVREVANGLEQATGAIHGRSVQDLTRSVAAFARRQPTTFLIGAALAGVALGRFARASGEHGSALTDLGNRTGDDRSGLARARAERYERDSSGYGGGSNRSSGSGLTPGRSAATTPVSPPVSAGTTAPRSSNASAEGSSSSSGTNAMPRTGGAAPAEGPSGAVLGHGSGSFNPEGGRDVR